MSAAAASVALLVVGLSSFSTLSPVSGFLYAPTTPTPFHNRIPSATVTLSLARRRHGLQLFMSNNNNVTLASSTNDDKQQETLDNKKLTTMMDSFLTSTAYRTFLLTGALFSSQNVRDVLGPVGCFVFASSVFAFWYQEAKFNYLVDVVTPKRQAALQAIRQFKTQQLTSTTGETNLQDLLNLYESTLQEELQTRVLVPNLWKIEMDPLQEDWSEAPRLLGMKITDQYTLEPMKTSSKTRSGSNER